MLRKVISNPYCHGYPKRLAALRIHKRYLMNCATRVDLRKIASSNSLASIFLTNETFKLPKLLRLVAVYLLPFGHSLSLRSDMIRNRQEFQPVRRGAPNWADRQNKERQLVTIIRYRFCTCYGNDSPSISSFRF